MIRHIFFLAAGLALGLGAGFSGGAVRSTESPQTPLSLVALGDSITAGYGVEPMKTYPELVAEGLRARTGRDVVVRNLGVNGVRARGLLDLLRDDERYRSAVRTADVIVVDIGTNDLTLARLSYHAGTCGGTDNRACLSQARRTFRDDIGGIVEEVAQLKKPDAQVVVLEVYFFYVGDTGLATKFDPPLQPDAELAQPGMLLRAVNELLQSAAERSGFRFAPARAAFNGESGIESPLARGLVLPPPDGVHPSPRGHEALAQAVLAALAP